MQRLTISTDDVPEADRFAYWREEVCEGLIGVSGERAKDEEPPFNGKLEGWIGDSIARFGYRSDRLRVLRRPRDIARRGWEDSFCLSRKSSAGGWFLHGHREFVTGSDDLMISDTTVPFATEPRMGYNHEMWLLPRRLLDPHLPVSRVSPCVVVTGSEGVAGLIKAYLDALAAQIDMLADSDVGVAADALCRLLAVACGGEAGAQGQALLLARIEEAKRYVGRHLPDPSRTPEKAARALKISVRQLHLLFEPTGTSFGQYVQRRRLEECRAALMNPVGDRSVMDVAFAWGFNSLPTFYRAFQQAFGATPGAVRAASSRDR